MRRTLCCECRMSLFYKSKHKRWLVHWLQGRTICKPRQCGVLSNDWYWYVPSQCHSMLCYAPPNHATLSSAIPHHTSAQPRQHASLALPSNTENVRRAESNPLLTHNPVRQKRPRDLRNPTTEEPRAGPIPSPHAHFVGFCSGCGHKPAWRRRSNGHCLALRTGLFTRKT